MLAETAPLKSKSSQSAREEAFSAPPLSLALRNSYTMRVESCFGELLHWDSQQIGLSNISGRVEMEFTTHLGGPAQLLVARIPGLHLSHCRTHR